MKIKEKRNRNKQINDNKTKKLHLEQKLYSNEHGPYKIVSFVNLGGNIDEIKTNLLQNKQSNLFYYKKKSTNFLFFDTEVLNDYETSIITRSSDFVVFLINSKEIDKSKLILIKKYLPSCLFVVLDNKYKNEAKMFIKKEIPDQKIVDYNNMLDYLFISQIKNTNVCSRPYMVPFSVQTDGIHLIVKGFMKKGLVSNNVIINGKYDAYIVSVNNENIDLGISEDEKSQFTTVNDFDETEMEILDDSKEFIEDDNYNSSCTENSDEDYSDSEQSCEERTSDILIEEELGEKFGYGNKLNEEEEFCEACDKKYRNFTSTDIEENSDDKSEESYYEHTCCNSGFDEKKFNKQVRDKNYTKLSEEYYRRIEEKKFKRRFENKNKCEYKENICKNFNDDSEEFDEIDKPKYPSLIDKYAEYKGIRNIATCDLPRNNYPEYYKKLLFFEDFKQVQKYILKRKSIIEDNQIIELKLKIENFGNEKILVLFNYYEFEQYDTILNFSFSSDTIIKSHEKKIVDYGHKLIEVNPIITKNANQIIFKVEEGLEDGVFSFIGPLSFNLNKILIFDHNCLSEITRDNFISVGVGMGIFERNVYSEVVLTGLPIKIFKRSCVIKRMFYSKEEVQFFKNIKLYTKKGRANGFIKKPLGVHGAFKAFFSQPILSNDKIYMSLYKREFIPK